MVNLRDYSGRINPDLLLIIILSFCYTFNMESATSLKSVLKFVYLLVC